MNEFSVISRTAITYQFYADDLYSFGMPVQVRICKDLHGIEIFLSVILELANLDYITKLTALRKSRRMSEELDFKELGKIFRNKARRFTEWGLLIRGIWRNI